MITLTASSHSGLELLFYFALVLICAGIFAIAHGMRHVWRQRMVRTKLVSKVESLRKGPAEIQGRSAEFKSLTSPLQGRPCVYWRYLVEIYRRGYRSGEWVTLEERRSAEPFYLEDTTGRILVDPHGVELEIPMTLHRDTSNGGTLPASCAKFARDKGLLATSAALNQGLRFTEWTIHAGEPLFVFGTVTEPRPKMARLYSLQEPVIRLEPILNHFYISNQSRRDVILSSAGQALLGIAGGAALILGGIALVVAMFS
jgi:hypothetical protein